MPSHPDPPATTKWGSLSDGVCTTPIYIPWLSCLSPSARRLSASWLGQHQSQSMPLPHPKAQALAAGLQSSFLLLHSLPCGRACMSKSHTTPPNSRVQAPCLPPCPCLSTISPALASPCCTHNKALAHELRFSLWQAELELTKIKEEKKEHLKGTQLISNFKEHSFDDTITTFWCPCLQLSPSKIWLFIWDNVISTFWKPLVICLNLLSKCPSLNASKYLSFKKEGKQLLWSVSKRHIALKNHFLHPTINVPMQPLFTKFLAICGKQEAVNPFDNRKSFKV